MMISEIQGGPVYYPTFAPSMDEAPMAMDDGGAACMGCGQEDISDSLMNPIDSIAGIQFPEASEFGMAAPEFATLPIFESSPEQFSQPG